MTETVVKVLVGVAALLLLLGCALVASRGGPLKRVRLGVVEVERDSVERQTSVQEEVTERKASGSHIAVTVERNKFGGDVGDIAGVKFSTPSSPEGPSGGPDRPQQ